MKVSDLEVGRYYARNGNPLVRRIKSLTSVGYLGGAVVMTTVHYERIGAKPGKCSPETFAAWASKDVTDEFRKKEGA